jgi:hypothetical protein
VNSEQSIFDFLVSPPCFIAATSVVVGTGKLFYLVYFWNKLSDWILRDLFPHQPKQTPHLESYYPFK